MTAGELQSRMSSAEFAEWMAYYRVEPFGEERADMRSGVLASLVANIHRDRKKRAEPYSPFDFMPVLKRGRDIDEAHRLAQEAETGGVMHQVRNLFSKKVKPGAD